jgi:hypothetical protein
LLPPFLLFAFNASAQTPSPPDAKSELPSITVEASRREAVREQASTFASEIALTRHDQSLANWQREIPVCFLVAGLPREDGEYMLARLSKIAATAGAPVAPKKDCKPNLFVVVASNPDALLKVWNMRDVRFYDNEQNVDSDQNVGGTEIRQFLDSKAPVRVWYNWELYNGYGVRGGAPQLATRIRYGAVRDLAAVVVLVNAPRVKGVSYGQLSAYIAMVGLAEIKPDAKVSSTPSILQLFSGSKDPAPPGLTQWDEAFLKGLYHTEHLDQHQLADIKAAMVDEIAPKQ